jgi:hypothetical protein
MRIGSIGTLNELSLAMEQAGRAIGLVSGNLDSEKLKDLIKTLTREDAKLDLKQDMIGETLDSIGEGLSNEVEEHKLYQQVLREAGMKVEEEVHIAK